MSIRTLAKSPVLAGNFVTGTYVGDGAATQTIVGVGFRPRLVAIYGQVDGATLAFKTDQDGALTYTYQWTTINWRWQTDMVVSLDADGFTVGDGTPIADNLLNAVGLTYTFVCFG